MHQCLRDSFSKLTEACRKEELKLNIIQARDVRLRPKLNKACSEEIAVFCKGVPPGARSCPPACCAWVASSAALSFSLPSWSVTLAVCCWKEECSLQSSTALPSRAQREHPCSFHASTRSSLLKYLEGPANHARHLHSQL